MIDASLLYENEDAQKLSTIIDVAASRFANDLQLEVDAQIDFKVKAKQFVKIYGQMASIMPFEVVDWEKLFWFLKFLIPKLKIEDPTKVSLDELLEAVPGPPAARDKGRMPQAHQKGAADPEPEEPNARAVLTYPSNVCSGE